MLSAFANALRTPDLRKKILFTLFILAVFRLGSVDPDPEREHRQREPVPARRRPPAATAPACTR